MQEHLIEPHGGKLVNLLVSPQQGTQMKKDSKEYIGIYTPTKEDFFQVYIDQTPPTNLS